MRMPILFALLASSLVTCDPQRTETPPNIVFILADEWRGQDTGFNGNKDVSTPNLDKLATQSVNVRNAISGVPVCSPYRASLLTGQYPLTHGVFVNDVLLDPEATTMSKLFKAAGYETAYIGKWHLDGHGRRSLIPEERRQGFEYWKVLECTHNYNNSPYWDNNNELKKWDGYDAFSQTEDAISYISARKDTDKPFLLMVSWGPPHTPFEQAPEAYKAAYKNKEIAIRPNVPEDKVEKTKKDLANYYAHISALDQSIGELQRAIAEAGFDENTIFVFTSDHGNMINSQAMYFKQKPWEESIVVPFLLKYPEKLGRQGFTTEMMLNSPDIMPTLLSLAGLQIPSTVEGRDLSPILKGEQKDDTEAVLISCPQPFGQWHAKGGGREYRGVRTKQFTYACDLNGPWLLYDNKKDPYQLKNLISDPDYAPVREKLHGQMQALLEKTNDEFLPGMDYIKKWGYVVDEKGTIPYHHINFRGDSIK